MIPLPYFSLIIPCYNTHEVIEKQLPQLLLFLASKKFSCEIILVDDGSADGQRLQSIAELYKCVYLKNDKNMGKGAAVRKGMLQAEGRFVLFTDSDIPFTYDSIDVILTYLDNKEFHLVVGDRTLETSSYYGKITLMRKLSSSLFTFFVGRFVTTGMNDTQCGLKGFRKEIAQDIFSVSRLNGFAFDVEIIYISMKRNYDIKRISVKLRNQEGSTVSLLRHSLPMILDLLKIKWNHIRGYYNKKGTL